MPPQTLKDIQYCKLKNVTHLKKYLNVIGVIDNVTPKIGTSKVVRSIDLELSDETMHNPGFVVKLLFPTDLLDKFMKVCCRGFVLEIRDMEMVKNEGIVYGEVTDEEDIKIYSDKAVHIPCSPKGKKHSATGFLKSRIETLCAWKEKHFDNSCDSDDLSAHSNTVIERKELRSSLVEKKSLKKLPKRSKSVRKFTDDNIISSESESDCSSSLNQSTLPRKRPNNQLNSDDSVISLDNSSPLKPKNVKTNTSVQRPLKRTLSDQSMNIVLKSNDRKKIRSTFDNLKASESNKGNTKKENTLNQLVDLLSPLARKIDLEAAKNVADVSFCEINEIEYCDKVDLQCKVISEHKLIDDGIQIIKVQDGTSRPGRTLEFPEGSSWNEITKRIEKEPLDYLKENSTVIDIVIFDFTRLNNHVESGKCYIFENVMALNLHMKGQKFTQKDLFFCVEGQNAYTRKMSPKQEATEEIIKKINAQKRLNDCNEIMQVDDEHPLAKVTKSPKTKDPSSNETKDEKVKRVQMQKKSEEASKHIANKSQKEKNSTVDRGKVKKPHDVEKKANLTESEHSFPPGQTPPAFRELKEIMNEASELCLPQTETEDIHLKNTGSQLNYTEFKKTADLKSKSFRTSTQEFNLSLTSCKDKVKLISDGETSDITSLKYQSSSSSSVDGEGKNASRESLDGNKVSQSVIECYEHVSPNKKTKKTTPNSKTPERRKKSDSGKKRVHSERSLEIIEVNPCYSSSDNDRSNTATERKAEKGLSSSSNKGKETRPGTLGSSEEVQHSEGEALDKEGSDCDSISLTILSDHISNHSKDFSRCSDKGSIEQKKSNNGNKWYNNPKNLLSVSSSSFLKSKYSPEHGKDLKGNSDLEGGETNKRKTRSTYEILRRQHIDRDLSFYKNAPIVPLETVWKLAYKNIITVYAFFTRINPTPDSWKDGIKSKCTNCKTEYKILNDERFTNYQSFNEESAEQDTFTAMSVLCPESQCCSKLLEPPEFDFCLDFKVRNNSSGQIFTALAKGKPAEKLFGCSASDVLKSIIYQKKVTQLLEKIKLSMDATRRCKITLTRKNITVPESGPLLLENIEWQL